MNLVTVILVLLVAWLMYSLVKSYNSLQAELREIRMKCVSGGANMSAASTNVRDPVTDMKSNVLGGLNRLLAATA